MRSLGVKRIDDDAGDDARSEEEEVVPAAEDGEEGRGDERDDEVADPVRGRREGHALGPSTHGVDLRAEQPRSGAPAMGCSWSVSLLLEVYIDYLRRTVEEQVKADGCGISGQPWNDGRCL